VGVLELFSLRGRVVVVTGGGSGLGRSISVAAGSAGAAVVVADIDGAAADATAEAIRAGGSEASGIRVDVADEDSVRGLFDAARAAHGPVDVAFCNAGISGYYRRIDQVDVAEWRRVLDINLTGVMLSAKYAAQQMIEQGRGKIVLTASIWGLIGSDSVPIPDYAAAKGGVVNLTRELALELAELGITVNAIAPGFFNTNIGRDKDLDPAIKQRLREGSLALIPTHRRAEPDEIGGAAIFLASAASDMVNGHVLVVDAGCLAR
jgi:NAD(P)-dependent dehydrogenase (short-subunit alcohol dehydrogenase family)